MHVRDKVPVSEPNREIESETVGTKSQTIFP